MIKHNSLLLVYDPPSTMKHKKKIHSTFVLLLLHPKNYYFSYLSTKKLEQLYIINHFPLSPCC